MSKFLTNTFVDTLAPHDTLAERTPKAALLPPQHSQDARRPVVAKHVMETATSACLCCERDKETQSAQQQNSKRLGVETDESRRRHAREYQPRDLPTLGHQSNTSLSRQRADSLAAAMLTGCSCCVLVSLSINMPQIRTPSANPDIPCSTQSSLSPSLKRSQCPHSRA